MKSSPLVSRGRIARSSLRFFRTCVPLVALSAVLATVTRAEVVYNESADGDFSNSGLTPTLVTLHPGSNQILGSTGRGTAVDRDYFTVTVPSGFTLTSLIELPGTTSGGAVSFLGLQAGNQVTLLTSTTTATGLLGWSHYGPADAGTDLLPLIAIPSNGSSGFTGPLSEGSYSFWIQDFNPGTFTYGFDLGVARAVPEPATYGLVGSGLILLLGLRRRWSKAQRAAGSSV